MQAGTSSDPWPVAIARRIDSPESRPSPTGRTPRGRPRGGQRPPGAPRPSAGRHHRERRRPPSAPFDRPGRGFDERVVASGPTAIRPYVAARRTFSRSSYSAWPSSRTARAVSPREASRYAARSGGLPLIVLGVQLREQPLRFDFPHLWRETHAVRMRRRVRPGQHPVVVVAPELGHVLIGRGHVDAGHRVHAQAVPIDVRNRCRAWGRWSDTARTAT